MSGPETNAPYQAESEVSSGNAVSRESTWKPEKDLSLMSSAERTAWLKGSDPNEDIFLRAMDGKHPQEKTKAQSNGSL